MKRLWRALAFLAAAGAALFLSTSALAVGAGSSRPPASMEDDPRTATWSGKLTALYPGARDDTEIFAFTVTNAGRVRAAPELGLASVPDGRRRRADGGRRRHRGCRATWFAVVVDDADRRLPLELAPGASYPGKVELSMRDSGTNQDACEGASPAIAVTLRVANAQASVSAGPVKLTEPAVPPAPAPPPAPPPPPEADVTVTV